MSILDEVHSVYRRESAKPLVVQGWLLFDYYNFSLVALYSNSR